MVFFEENSQVHVRLRISGQRFRLRLRGGREFRNATTILRQVIRSELMHGELSLLERITGGAQYQHGHDRRTGMHTRLMLHLPVWIPRTPTSTSQKKCTVRTSANCLWTVRVEGHSRDWDLYQDQIIRWTRAYHRQLERLKMDARIDPRGQASLATRRKRTQLKFHRRIQDVCHKLAAHLVNLCRRQAVGIVEYCDADKQWLNDFAWYQLRNLCATKCDAAGIRFVHLTPDNESTDNTGSGGATRSSTIESADNMAVSDEPLASSDDAGKVDRMAKRTRNSKQQTRVKQDKSKK